MKFDAGVVPLMNSILLAVRSGTPLFRVEMSNPHEREHLPTDTSNEQVMRHAPVSIAAAKGIII